MKTLLTILLALGMATTVLAQSGNLYKYSGKERSSKSASKSASLGAYRVNPYNPDSLANPWGAGSRYRSNGLMSPYSPYGSRYSNRSWRNPYATQSPQLYSGGKYRGRMSTNRYAPDSISNRYGRFGSPYSSDSVRNPFGVGNPYSTQPIYVWPGY